MSGLIGKTLNALYKPSQSVEQMLDRLDIDWLPDFKQCPSKPAVPGRLRRYSNFGLASGGKTENSINRVGLDNVNLVGTRSLNESNIRYIAQETIDRSKPNTFVANLKGETSIVLKARTLHSFGREISVPASVFRPYMNNENENCTLTQIEEKEDKLVAYIADRKASGKKIMHLTTSHLLPWKKKHLLMWDIKATTEKKLCEENGVDYLRLPRTDHRGVSAEHSDKLHARSQLGEGWVHCRAGKGRTSNAALNVDTKTNASKVSLEDIEERHAEISKYNFHSKSIGLGHFRKECAEGRANFYKKCQLEQNSSQSSLTSYEITVGSPLSHSTS